MLPGSRVRAFATPFCLAHARSREISLTTMHLKSAKVPSTQPITIAASCLSAARAVGNTPVLWIDDRVTGSRHGFWAKLEGFNPGGIKDRPALHMVAKAKERGQLAAGAPIVESTSGTLGLGLALAGIVHDHPVTVVTDPGMEPIVQRMLAAHGARVELVAQPHPTGGWQQARRDRVRQLLVAQPDAWSPDQYNNPDNVAAYASLADEMVAQLGRIDILVCSVGTGGHSAGVFRILQRHFPHLRLIGVDTIGSTIFGQPATSRLMRGLGSSIYPGNVDYDAFDEVHWVSPHEAVRTCRDLAATHHATGGWSVGAVALVAAWVARTHDREVRVAAVFPDGPQRYFDTVYNNDYCTQHGLLNTPPTAEPDTIATTGERVVKRWTRCATVTDPALDVPPRPVARAEQQ